MSGDVVFSSTTDNEATVNQAADHDVTTGHAESSHSGGNVVVVSTTDSQEEVSQAAGLDDTAAEEGAEGYFTPIVMSEDKSVASTTDDQESVDQAAEDLREEVESRVDYLTGRSSVKKRIAQLVKERGTLENENARLRQQLAGENARLREELAGRQQAPAAEASSEQPVEGDSEQQPQAQAQPQLTQDQLRQQAEWGVAESPRRSDVALSLSIVQTNAS